MSPAVFHSVEYKARSQLSRRRVMILGTGETGMDLAYEAVKAGATEVVLCSRSGLDSFWLLLRTSNSHVTK
jgi:dimethylaniline monooxygenase (N-oxide forming)